MKDGARIGELARAGGVGVQTVRYYERLGLLFPVARSRAGYRIYPSKSLDRLRFIRQAQAVGLSLDEIGEILRIRDSGKAPCDCVRGLLERKLDHIENTLRELAGFRRLLHRTLARSRTLPRLPHEASALCPIIQKAPASESRSKRLRVKKHFQPLFKEKRSGNPTRKEN